MATCSWRPPKKQNLNSKPACLFTAHRPSRRWLRVCVFFRSQKSRRSCKWLHRPGVTAHGIPRALQIAQKKVPWNQVQPSSSERPVEDLKRKTVVIHPSHVHVAIRRHLGHLPILLTTGATVEAAAAAGPPVRRSRPYMSRSACIFASSLSCTSSTPRMKESTPRHVALDCRATDSGCHVARSRAKCHVVTR